MTEASTTADTVELTWTQPTDFGTTDGTKAATFGSYMVKVYEGADEGGSEVEGLTLEPSSLDESTVSVKVSGLSSGTQYAFKLALSNGNDPPLSSDSNVVSETTKLGTAPAGLRDLAVTEASTTADTVELTWTQPTDFGTTDGTKAATFGSYMVKVYEGADEGGSEVEGLTLEPTSLDESTVSVKVSGLRSGTQYAFKLVLSNGNDSPLSSDSNIVSETTKGPTAPAGLRDLAVAEASTTADTVELTWSQPTDFGTTDGTTAATFGSYMVKVYEGADEGGSEVEGLTLEPSSLDENTVSVKVSGLSSDTQYAFKLVLSNGNDSPLSSDSNVVSETTKEPTAPAGLKDLAVTEASTTVESVELTWSQPTDFGTTDGTTAAIFGSYEVKVYEGADEGGSEVEGLTLTPASLGESTVSVRVSGLSPGTQYAFKLVLSNGNDSPLSSDSNVVSETTKEPTAPAGLKDLAVTEASTTVESVELTWSQPTDFGTTDGTTAAIFGSYEVKVYEGADEGGSEVEGLTLTPASLGESTVSVRVSGLSPGTQYAFKLVLSNGNDSPLSSDSNVVSETTKEPTAPAGLKDLAVTEASTTVESVELTWSRPTDFGTTDGTTAAIFGSYAVKVYEGADEGGSEVEGLTLTPASLDESTVSVKVSGLSSDTQYAFKLVLSNGNDSPLSSDSNIVSETTKGPTAPAGLRDLAVKGGSITVEGVELIWSRPTDFGTTDGTTAAIFGSYVVKVYEGADEGGSEVEGLTLTPASLYESTVSVKVSGLKPLTQYAFKLVLSNGNDSPLSSDSNVVGATTQDPRGRIWNEVPVSGDWFIGREAHAAVVFDNKIWVIGGDAGGTYTNDVWSSPDGESWTEVVTNDPNAARFSGRDNHAAVVFDNKLWVIGGYNGARFNDVWSSPDGKIWTEETKDVTTPWFSERQTHTAVVFDNKIWVIGGSDGRRLNDVWSSPDGKSWTEVVTHDTGAARFAGRSNHATTVFDGKIWVIAGYSDSARFNDVWSSPDGKIWTEETKNVTTSRFAVRYEHSAVEFDNKLWVIGGYSRDGSTILRFNDVWSSSDGKSWTEVKVAQGVTAPKFSKRFDHDSVVFDGKIWVLGGNDGTYKNDVWYSP